ncbi:MAG TPA: ATP synthase F1 subunit delta [Planctomycetaceae bacterium]|nr:ATP synthase F1 subunit delta [Planctomycetaceae bacterium]
MATHRDSQDDMQDATSAPLDPSAERIARVYAQAIIEAADRKGCRAEVLDELGAFARDVVGRVPRAREVLSSPQVSIDDKRALIDRLATGRMLPTTVHTLHVLARHGRLGIVAEVAHAARRLADELAGRQPAVFKTAVALDPAARTEIVRDVERSLAVSLAPTFVVDPDIIGGLVVRIGDTVYDQSIASGLARLGQNLHRRSMHEIQHGRDRLAPA